MNYMDSHLHEEHYIEYCFSHFFFHRSFYMFCHYPSLWNKYQHCRRSFFQKHLHICQYLLLQLMILAKLKKLQLALEFLFFVLFCSRIFHIFVVISLYTFQLEMQQITEEDTESETQVEGYFIQTLHKLEKRVCQGKIIRYNFQISLFLNKGKRIL